MRLSMSRYRCACGEPDYNVRQGSAGLGVYLKKIAMVNRFP